MTEGEPGGSCEQQTQASAGSGTSDGTGAAAGSDASKKQRQRRTTPASPACRIAGCSQALTHSYNKLHRICAAHRAALQIEVAGQAQALRYCQQCTKVHTVDEFGGDARSCQHSLQRRRQRKRRQLQREAGGGGDPAHDCQPEPEPRQQPGSRPGERSPSQRQRQASFGASSGAAPAGGASWRGSPASGGTLSQAEEDPGLQGQPWELQPGGHPPAQLIRCHSAPQPLTAPMSAPPTPPVLLPPTPQPSALQQHPQLLIAGRQLGGQQALQGQLPLLPDVPAEIRTGPWQPGPGPDKPALSATSAAALPPYASPQALPPTRELHWCQQQPAAPRLGRACSVPAPGNLPPVPLLALRTQPCPRLVEQAAWLLEDDLGLLMGDGHNVVPSEAEMLAIAQELEAAHPQPAPQLPVLPQEQLPAAAAAPAAAPGWPASPALALLAAQQAQRAQQAAHALHLQWRQLLQQEQGLAPFPSRFFQTTPFDR